MATINNSYHNNRDKDFVRDKGDKKNGSGQELKEIYLQKFSAGLLAEVVIIPGVPKFLVSRDGKISIESSIGLSLNGRNKLFGLNNYSILKSGTNITPFNQRIGF
jgi:hypothetical protein